MPAPATENLPLLLYLHGFNSSPASQKARELGDYLLQVGAQCEYRIPSLSVYPQQAMDSVVRLVREAGRRPVALVGSSLGGYYAAWLSAQLDCPAALINPAAYPYQLLRDYLGWQENPYTGERYWLGESEMDALRALEVTEHPSPRQLLVLLQAADETLDYREAHQRFADSPQWIIPGGNHRFRDFPRFLPAILGFLGIKCPGAR